MENSASFNAGVVLGHLVGFVLLYGGILALGVYFAGRLSRNRGYGDKVRWPIVVAFLLDIVLLLGQCSAAARGA